MSVIGEPLIHEVIESIPENTPEYFVEQTRRLSLRTKHNQNPVPYFLCVDDPSTAMVRAIYNDFKSPTYIKREKSIILALDYEGQRNRIAAAVTSQSYIDEIYPPELVKAIQSNMPMPQFYIIDRPIRVEE